MKESQKDSATTGCSKLLDIHQVASACQFVAPLQHICDDCRRLRIAAACGQPEYAAQIMREMQAVDLPGMVSSLQ